MTPEETEQGFDEGGPLVDGRQSAAALEIQRGVQRLLYQHGFASVTEFPLPNGRRADVIGLNEAGEIWIVEIKSSLADFRADQKWPEYRDFSDRLFFAVKPDFPKDVLPEVTGLIFADRFGGEIMREAPETRLAGARRKALTQSIARHAALRLTALTNPALAGIINPKV
jgi:hypothetical protein